MQWIPCSVIECSGFHAEWWNVSRLNEVDPMQLVVIDTDWMHGFHAVWLNALDSMQQCEMHPEWMQWIACSLAQWIPIECSGFHEAWLNALDPMQRCEMHPEWMKWNPCSVIECSWFHAVWRMYPNWMPYIPCSIVQWIPMECRGFTQCGPKVPDWMQGIPCSIIECSGFYAEWCNVSRLLKCIRCRLM